MSRCYNCNSPYHYSNRCPTRSCRKTGHYSDKCPNDFERSIEGTIVFIEMWGKNSAKIAEDCILAKIKRVIIQKFLDIGIITIEDIDVQNFTPHININGYKAIYDTLNGSKIILHPSSILIKKDHLEIQIGARAHFTVLYKHDIGNKHDEVRQLIDESFLTFLPSNEEILTSDW